MMKIKYDNYTEITLTSRFEAAIIELMQAETEMMAKVPGFDSDNWYWGRCEIVDLSLQRGLRFDYGSEADMPQDGLGRFAIINSKE